MKCLHLKRLEIYGFKSFADRTEIVFERGITGVVGPNGSGKSNVADAVRWVLGEQSARTLRGTRMEDIIFNGTEKRKKLSMAEVTLVFDNVDGSLDMPYSELSVTRRIYRSGESEYLINGNSRRLKDVVALFQDTGIGKEGYSIIGQGRIGDILTPKSEERRVIFEEAAGVVKYKTRKEEAERKLGQTDQNLVRIEDILEELSGQVEPLREQSEAARRYLDLRDELKDLDINLFLHQNKQIQARQLGLRETLADIEGQRTKGQEELASLEERYRLFRADLERMDGEILTLREQILELTRQSEAAEGESKVLDERRENARIGREQLLGQIRETEDRLADLKKQQEEAAAHGEELEQKLAGEAADLETHRQSTDALGEKVASEEVKLEAAKSEVIDNLNRLSSVKTRRERLLTMRDTLVQRQSELQTQQSERTQQEEQLKADMLTAEELLRDAKIRLNELEGERNRVKASRQEAEARAEHIRNRLKAVEQSAQQIASRLHVMEEMQKDREGYFGSIRNLMREAHRLPQGGAGIVGTVADLMRVPKTFEKAIEMALGASLQHVVTRREEDAKAAIDLLRERQFGRATFLPMTSVKGRTLNAGEKATLSDPGIFGVASDLVEFDQAYRGIMENLLGRTVIVKDMDTGIQLMRKNRYAFRVVTLLGDTLNVGGSMTGGSQKSQYSSLLSRGRMIEELKGELTQTEKSLGDHRAKLTEVLAEAEAVESELVEIGEAWHQQDIAVARENERYQTAQGHYAEHLKGSEALRLEQERLSESLAEVVGELGEIESQQGVMERSDGTTRDDILRLQEAMNVLRQEHTAALGMLGTLQAAHAGAARDLEAARRDVRRLEGERAENERVLARLQNELETRKDRMDEDSREREELARRIEASRATLWAVQAEVERRQQDRQKLALESENLERQQKELSSRLEELLERQYRTQSQLERLESDLQNIHNRIWDDYELTYNTALPLGREDFKPSAASSRAGAIRREMRQMGDVNVNAIEEYKRVSQRFTDLTEQREDLVKAKEDLKGLIAELLGTMEVQFKEQFAKLNENFKETFVELFGGGTASLQLSDESDVLNCNIEIIAQPPGKKLQVLSLLSGGERSLTAAAILFAILRLKPTPFCILDEIEAALDDANIGNFVHFLKDYAKNTQFVVITHRKETMTACDALYGFSMEEKGVSRLMSVKLA